VGNKTLIFVLNSLNSLNSSRDHDDSQWKWNHQNKKEEAKLVTMSLLLAAACGSEAELIIA